MAGPMQKAASAVEAETSFRTAARTSPGAVRDLQRAELAHLEGRRGHEAAPDRGDEHKPRKAGVRRRIARCL